MSKRDGRREWLRATKLARSIRIALEASGVEERCQSLDFATEIVSKLHRVRADAPIPTATLSAMAREGLIRGGFSLAALLFAEESQRSRRVAAASLSSGANTVGDSAGDSVGDSVDEDRPLEIDLEGEATPRMSAPRVSEDSSVPEDTQASDELEDQPRSESSWLDGGRFFGAN